MMSEALSPAAERLLRDAGWHPGRRIDLALVEAQVRNAGYPALTASQRSFLAEFGGLRVKHPHAKVPTRQDWFDLDVRRACEYSREYMLDAIDTVGAPLTAIGHADSDNVSLLMDADGRVYGSIDDWVFYYGAGVEAIESLCAGKALMQLPERGWSPPPIDDGDRSSRE